MKTTDENLRTELHREIMKTETLHKTILSQAIQITELKEENADLNQATENARKWLLEQKEELALLKGSTAKKEFKTAENINKLCVETMKAKATIAALEKEAEEQTQQIHSQMRKISELENQITAGKEENARFKNELDLRKTKIDNLLGDTQRLKTENLRLKNEKS